jgi:hypothetical protein
MSAAYAVERLRFAVPPLIEKFACLALRDIETRSLRQPPGYCGHNLTSCNVPVVRIVSGRKSGRVVGETVGRWAEPISADGMPPVSIRI